VEDVGEEAGGTIGRCAMAGQSEGGEGILGEIEVLFLDGRGPGGVADIAGEAVGCGRGGQRGCRRGRGGIGRYRHDGRSRGRRGGRSRRDVRRGGACRRCPRCTVSSARSQASGGDVQGHEGSFVAGERIGEKGKDLGLRQEASRDYD
jgi:hypothetical protein